MLFFPRCDRRKRILINSRNSSCSSASNWRKQFINSDSLLSKKNELLDIEESPVNIQSMEQCRTLESSINAVAEGKYRPFSMQLKFPDDKLV